jgi:hypothetical protein
MTVRLENGAKVSSLTCLRHQQAFYPLLIYNLLAETFQNSFA